MSGMKMLPVLLLLALGVGCSRATTEDCRKAVANIQRLRGLDNSAHAPDQEAFVRRCKSSAKPDAVRCLIGAKTLAELDACEPRAATK